MNLQELWINLVSTLYFYSEYYQQYALKRWHGITPFEYGCLLIGVGVFGWVLMKSASRK